jgi:hypothetical protein
MIRGTNEVVDVDLATGAVIRRAEAGSDDVEDLVCGSSDVLAVRTERIGNLWMADLAGTAE